jgi:beta-galactosidase GanA
MDRFFDGVKALGANTAETPVYWELVEPEPGRFDFRLVDALVEKARARGVRLVLLWFASWKNGEMHYAPAWVRNTATYRRSGPAATSGGSSRRSALPPATPTPGPSPL